MPSQAACAIAAPRRTAAGAVRAWLGLALAVVSCASSPPPPPGWGPTEYDLERRCQAGASAACGELGSLLVDKEGASQRELDRGLVLMEIGCGQGDVATCTALGLMYGTRFKGDKSRPRAVELLSRACTQRSAAACTGLGELLRFGPGADRRRARESLQAGCEMGDARGCELYAVANLGGGFGNSGATAEQYFMLACARGLRSSCHRLAMSWMADPGRRGRGIVDLVGNCEKGYGPSCTAAAGVFAPLRGPDADCVRAVPLARRACGLGDPEGCAIGDACDLEGAGRAAAVARLYAACESGVGLGCLYWADAQSGAAASADDVKQVERAYGLACDSESAGAPIACARAAAGELAAAKNAEQADSPLSFLKQACGNSIADACCALSRAYEGGNWLAADAARASELRAKACALGDRRCCQSAPPR
jgi:TPR repeat protein